MFQKLKTWLSPKVLNLLNDRICNRPADILIDEDYMERWYVIPRNRWFNIYFHRFFGSDAPVPHDHPWWSVSWILHGWYIENTPTGKFVRMQGDITYRPAEGLHWIQIDQPVWTLFITGRKKRTWGFQCPKGWVSFDKYIANRGESRLARGCGEYE